MDPEDTCPEEQTKARVIVEVPNSQNTQSRELEYNPFASQTLSQAGSSKQSIQPIVEIPKSTTVRKRRGRPSKDTFVNLKPTRESQRQRTCPKVFNYQSFQDSKLQWSERDKKLFLVGCLKVGIEDIQGLKKYLPHKTEYEIRRQIGMWKYLASRDIEKDLLLVEKSTVHCGKIKRIMYLDEWVHYFKEKGKESDASTFVISNIFSLIADCGMFPSVGECGGIDIRAMYRYVHCMMNGIPPYGLNTETSKALLRCIDNVQEQLNDPNLVDSMEDHLFNLPLKPEKWNKKYGKTYSRKVSNTSAKAIDQILNNSIMNPLNLPESAVRKAEPEEYEEDSDED